MLNGLQSIQAAILLRSIVYNRENGDLKHKKGTQIPKKIPMGTRVPKRGPIATPVPASLSHPIPNSKKVPTWEGKVLEGKPKTVPISV